MYDVLYVAPSQPRDVKVSLVTPLIVEINWREPAVPNGHIIHYTVYAIPIAQFEPERRRRQAIIDFPGTIKKVLYICSSLACKTTFNNIKVKNHVVVIKRQRTYGN